MCCLRELLCGRPRCCRPRCCCPCPRPRRVCRCEFRCRMEEERGHHGGGREGGHREERREERREEHCGPREWTPMEHHRGGCCGGEF